MKNRKNLPPAYKIVKSYGQGSFTRLANFMQKTTVNVCATLKKRRLHWKNQFDYLDAINECFGEEYKIDDLFPKS